jgi:hypothetical protein
MTDVKKKSFRIPLWGWGVLGVITMGAAVGIALNLPQHGSFRYGACRVFLESYIRFPSSIDIITANENPNIVTISFSDINPYGAEQIRDFKCYFAAAPGGKTLLTKITLDDGMKKGARPLPDHITKNFNAMLPTLRTTELNTKLPEATHTGSLENLQE